MPGKGMIPYRPVMPMPVGAPARDRRMTIPPPEATITTTPPKSIGEGPIVPGRPDRVPAEAPGGRPAVPIVANPGRIGVACAVDDRAVRTDLRSQVSGSVAFVD